MSRRAAAVAVMVMILGACSTTPVAPGRSTDEGVRAAGWREALGQEMASTCGEKLINDSILESGTESQGDRVWRTWWRMECGEGACFGVIVSGDAIEARESGRCTDGERERAFEGAL